uniref:Uncharacterized protein n=1 Tax=Triticum urartu TaxID=4572 RepID=A0A8R7TQ43_TRIUA
MSSISLNSYLNPSDACDQVNRAQLLRRGQPFLLCGLSKLHLEAEAATSYHPEAPLLGF